MGTLIAMGISGVVGLALLFYSTRMEENSSKSTLKRYGAANAAVALAILSALCLFSSHDTNDPLVIAGIIMRHGIHQLSPYLHPASQSGRIAHQT